MEHCVPRIVTTALVLALVSADAWGITIVNDIRFAMVTHRFDLDYTHLAQESFSNSEDGVLEFAAEAFASLEIDGVAGEGTATVASTFSDGSLWISATSSASQTMPGGESWSGFTEAYAGNVMDFDIAVPHRFEVSGVFFGFDSEWEGEGVNGASVVLFRVGELGTIFDHYTWGFGDGEFAASGALEPGSYQFSSHARTHIILDSYEIPAGDHTFATGDTYMDFYFRLTPVPLPPAFFLMSCALVSLGFAKRRVIATQRRA